MDEVVEPIPFEMRKRVQMIAALDVLNTVYASEIVQMADDMLNQCIYDDLFVAIIDSDPKDQFAVHRYLERYCNKIGIAYPPEHGARLIVLDHYLRRIVEPSSNPDEESSELERLLGGDHYHELHRQFEELSNMMAIRSDYRWEMECEGSQSVQENHLQMMRAEAAKLLAKDGYQEALAVALKV